MIIIYFLIAVIVIILLVALILPSNYNISKSIVVNAPIQNCYLNIADLNHYKEWNPWAQMEPDALGVISGVPNTIGHQYEWDGKKIGMGGLTITKINQPHSVELELEFLKPFKSKAIDRWIFEVIEDNNVKITWTNSGELSFPIPRLMGPFIRKNLNKQFEQGLKNFKNLCEKNNSAY